MIPASLVTTVAGPTRWVSADYNIAPFQLSIAVTVTGTANYTVQYTYDDLPGPVAPSAFNDSILVNQTATGDTTINGPITGWRVFVNSITGGSLRIRGVQAGMP